MDRLLLPVVCAQPFLDIPTVARLCMAARGVATLDSWRRVDRQLWLAGDHEGPWNEHAVPIEPLHFAFPRNARELWTKIFYTLFQLQECTVACPGMIERATAEVFVLGINKCRTMSERGLRRLAHLERSQPEATVGFLLQWLEDCDLGDDIMEAFAAMNANNDYVKLFLDLVEAGVWTFRLYPAQWHRDLDDAIAILELEIYGFTAVIVMTEIFVNPYGFAF